MDARESPEGSVDEFLPLAPRDFLILFALVDGARHGYDILQSVDRESRGRVTLDPANLYRSFKRLMKRGLIAESEKRPAADPDNVPRRYYSLTRLGAAVVEAEATRLAALADAARAKRVIPEPGEQR